MKTKEESIKEAWGDKYSKKVDENGWLSERYLTNYECITFNNSDCFEVKGIGSGEWKYRPKSLQGIENNNWWIRIESEADLPKIGEYDMSSFKLYYFTSNGLYESEDYRKWNSKYKITHYRLEPIFKPNKPHY